MRRRVTDGALFVRVWRDVTVVFVTASFQVCGEQKAPYEVDRFNLKLGEVKRFS